MICIIPCAGKGTRRRPETKFTPKILLGYPNPLAPLVRVDQGRVIVRGDKGWVMRPIEHIARPIDASGCFERIVFVLSPKHGNQVIDYIRRNPLGDAGEFCVAE